MMGIQNFHLVFVLVLSKSFLIYFSLVLLFLFYLLKIHLFFFIFYFSFIGEVKQPKWNRNTEAEMFFWGGQPNGAGNEIENLSHKSNIFGFA